MASKYVDTTAILQVIGSVYNNLNLLDLDDTFAIHEEDFQEDFHRIVYGTLYHLHESGVSHATLEVVNDFLETRPKQKAIYEVNRGNEFLLKTSQLATAGTFKYYYDRVKKMTLLRMYDNFGVDVSFLYDPDNIFDNKIYTWQRGGDGKKEGGSRKEGEKPENTQLLLELKKEFSIQDTTSTQKKSVTSIQQQ